jgi:wyosine [tRNA(Phe)-imidazoG37] synthetase (radical SAM superfamily)
MSVSKMPEDPCFGPVPSRRLGRSLGVNNVPHKTCSYSCVYCQVGPTEQTTVERRTFVPSQAMAEKIRARLEDLASRGERVDYVTFVPDGEPTLDVELGPTLAALQDVPVPLAVISNASLLSDPQVRRALAGAAWVSLKVDAADAETWRRINRPDPRLRFDDLVEGARRFAEEYQGTLVTETMLVDGINDEPSRLEAIAARVAELRPQRAYLGLPTRPASESWVRTPDEETVARAFAIFEAQGLQTEVLAGYPEPDFPATDDVAGSLLRITAVHPMRRIEVEQLVRDSGASWATVESLLRDGALREVEHEGEAFYVRRLSHPSS